MAGVAGGVEGRLVVTACVGVMLGAADEVDVKAGVGVEAEVGVRIGATDGAGIPPDDPVGACGLRTIKSTKARITTTPRKKIAPKTKACRRESVMAGYCGPGQAQGD